MTKASDNPFPYMRYVEQGSTPSNPAAGSQRLFVRSSDHVLCMVDSAGTVTALSGSLTNPMSAVDDIIIGGTAGAPARLVKGNAGAALAMGNGHVIWNAGSSFPGSKATNDRYFRTDLGMEAFWNGSNWVTVTEYRTLTTGPDLPGTASATPNMGRALVPSDYDIYVTTIDCSTFIATTNDGSHYWTFTATKLAANNVGTSLGNFTTAADTVNNWTHHQLVVNANVDRATYFALAMAGAKTSTPGAPSWALSFGYRLVLA